MKKVLGVCLLFVMVLSSFAFLLRVDATDYTLADLDTQITKALDWLDRFIYLPYNSTNAVTSCSPFISFRIRHPNGYNWTVSDKQTNNGNYQNGGFMYKGGCDTMQSAADRGMISSSYPKVCLYYKFDVDNDGQYDSDIILYVEYAAVNDTYCGLGINCTQQPYGSNYALFLGTNTTAMSTSLAFNNTWKIYQQWGFTSPYYFMRPTLKGLADLYYKLNVTVNPTTGHTYAYDRGINYTDRSYKLMKTFYGVGYLLDRFDGMYNVTLKERPFSDLTGGIGANPDMVYENVWNMWNNDNSQGYKGFVYGYDYYGNGYWVNYSSCNWTYTGNSIWRSAACCRTIMPDESWFSAPVQCDNTTTPIWCYRSRTGDPLARNCYISNGFYVDLVKQGHVANPITNVLMGVGADAQMLRVCSDLYKYGYNQPLGLSVDQQMIDHVVWDGYGVPVDYVQGSMFQMGWQYPVYANHVNAPYLNALVQYYKVTGDSEYIVRADSVAAVMLGTQIKQGTANWNKAKSTSYYMPDSVGAFMSGYCVAYSYGFGDILFTPWDEFVFGLDRGMYDLTGGAVGFRHDWFPHATFGSAESTIPCVWSLIEYRQLGRVPPVYSNPDIVMPFSDVVATADHGGSSGGDGSFEVTSNCTDTAIQGGTGNVHQFSGKVDRLRLTAQGLSGSGWSSIRYDWNFTTTATYSSVRWKVEFSIPQGYAQLGESGYNGLNVTVWLKYRDNSTVLANETTNILSNKDNGDFHGMFALNDTCALSTLYAQNYSVTLKFYLWGSASGEIRLGWHGGYDIERDMPMGVESFGFDYDHTPVVLNQKFPVDKQGSGTVSNTTTMYIPNYSNTTAISANPSAGNYFWFWTANNSVIGTAQYPAHGRFYGANNASWVMNATQDYNITAWFGSVNYTKKYEGLYSFTIYCDLNFDGSCDMKDTGYVATLNGKKVGDADWFSSGAAMVDLLCVPDGVINGKDTGAVSRHYGDKLINLVW